jgi:sialic acid synthase SpsE
LFSKDWVEAKDMQHALRNIAAALGYGESEIFPKQIKLNLERRGCRQFP